MRTFRLFPITMAIVVPGLSVFFGVTHASPERASHKAVVTHKPSSAANLPLIDVAGYERALAKYRGKPIMVAFWATWCEPCRWEFPLVVQLAHEYQPKGLAVFGVNLDDDADMHLVRDFLAKNQPPFPSYRQKPGIDVDAFYRGVNPAWTGTMPQTIFYDRNGKMAEYFFGAQQREAFEAGIRAVLSNSSSGASR